jgi:endonuclease/exonuclease/phosphatase (EEP) superfamily protein YafD
MKTWKLLLVVFLAFGAPTAVWFVATGGHSYLYALLLESKWRAARPQTKQEMEAILSFYREKEIQPAQSSWGRNYHLEQGERMVQYQILYDSSCPLDVVYDSEDKVRVIFTSYE